MLNTNKSNEINKTKIKNKNKNKNKNKIYHLASPGCTN